jgi:hypothetical protein
MPLVGIIKFGNDEMIELGLNEGDRVVFEPESEYPFYVNGEKVYRMYTKNLTIKLNEQDNGIKKEDN